MSADFAPDNTSAGTNKRRKQQRYAQFIDAAPDTDFKVNEKTTPFDAAMGLACCELENIFGTEALGDKNFRSILLTAAGDYITIRGTRHRKDAAKKKMEKDDVDLIPRSARFKFGLQAPAEVQESEDFKTLSTEVDDALEECSKTCQQKIIATLALTSKHYSDKLHKSFVKHLPTFIESILIEDEIEDYHKHRVFVDLLASFPESVLNGQIVGINGEQLKELYKSVHGLDSLPSTSTTNPYNGTRRRNREEREESGGESGGLPEGLPNLLLTENSHESQAGRTEDDGTGDGNGDAAMEEVSAPAVVYKNDAGVQTFTRTSLLVKVRGAITAAYI